MNGTKKFHKGNGTAFDIGQQWQSISGKIKCTIIGRRKFGTGKWDYLITYRYTDGAEHSKDAWNFQVRYEHIADKFI